jgi:hypothetical protein
MHNSAPSNSANRSQLQQALLAAPHFFAIRRRCRLTRLRSVVKDRFVVMFA